MSRAVAAVKAVAFSLVPVAILYATVEGASYLVTHRTPETVTDPATGEAYYTMRIGLLPWSPRGTTPLNSLGFPDEEFESVEKGDCLHVVFAGDSFTFGDSVDREKNYVSLVAQTSASRFAGRCIRYFNIAERMTTIEQQSQRILETIELLEPDIVVLGQYQNDLTDLTMPGSIAWRPPSESESTNHWGERLTRIPGYDNATVRLITYRAFASLITRDIEYDAPLAAWSVLADPRKKAEADRLTAIYSEIYRELVRELRKREIDFGVVILPSKLDVLAKRYPEEEFFVSLARQNDVPYLSVFPALNDVRRPYAFQMYDGHMNEVGNALTAAEVASWLFDRFPPPFPVLRASPEPGWEKEDAGSDSRVTGSPDSGRSHSPAAGG